MIGGDLPVDDEVWLLHQLAHDCLRQSRARRALALLALALRSAPGEPALLRTLAYTLLADDRAEDALAVVGQLRGHEAGGSRRDDALPLLESRALLALGRVEEARAAFARATTRHRGPSRPAAPDDAVSGQP